MKRVIGLLALGAGLALSLPAGAEPTYQEMKYLGYTDEISKYAIEQTGKTHSDPYAGQPTAAKVGKRGQGTEADAVQEQLTELGRTRSLTPAVQTRSEEVKLKVDTYWQNMRNDDPSLIGKTLSPEFKADLHAKMEKALVEAGYTVCNLALLDLPPTLGTPQVRAVIRVVKPIQAADSYQEIQANLIAVKNICTAIGNVNGVNYLGELSTFVAENPRNRYHYAKTILHP